MHNVTLGTQQQLELTANRENVSLNFMNNSDFRKIFNCYHFLFFYMVFFP